MNIYFAIKKCSLYIVYCKYIHIYLFSFQLLDGGVITLMRTAAASAVALKVSLIHYYCTIVDGMRYIVIRMCSLFL